MIFDIYSEDWTPTIYTSNSIEMSEPNSLPMLHDIDIYNEVGADNITDDVYIMLIYSYNSCFFDEIYKTLKYYFRFNIDPPAL